IDLFGNAISLRGAGELNIDGSDIDLDFSVDWARFNQVLPPGIKSIPPAISDQLLKIKMRGRFGDVVCTREPMPGVMGPLRKMVDGMRPQSPPAPDLPAPQYRGRSDTGTGNR